MMYVVLIIGAIIALWFSYAAIKESHKRRYK